MPFLLSQTQWTFDLFTWDMKVASALFSVTNSTSQWWNPSPWQNHSRKSVFNNWKLAIIAARTEIAGSLSSTWGTSTSCSCLTGSFAFGTNRGWEARIICSFPCWFRIDASKSSISAVAENCDDLRLVYVRLLTLFSTVIFFLLEEGAYTVNGNESQRSQTDFEIHISVQRCLRDFALIAEVIKLLNTGEGTIWRIFTLSKHFGDLIFFTQ